MILPANFRTATLYRGAAFALNRLRLYAYGDTEQFGYTAKNLIRE